MFTKDFTECVKTVPEQMEFPPEMYEDDFVPQTHEEMTLYWGEKCPDYDDECSVCAAWRDWERNFFQR